MTSEFGCLEGDRWYRSVRKASGKLLHCPSQETFGLHFFMDVTNAAVPESPIGCLWNFIAASLIKICRHIPVFGLIKIFRHITVYGSIKIFRHIPVFGLIDIFRHIPVFCLKYFDTFLFLV
jgi:hypothetical protein